LIILVKSAPKKSFNQQIVSPIKKLAGQNFFGALFNKVRCTFLKSVWKDDFFDTPSDLYKGKKFCILIEESMFTFYELKSPKC